MSFLLWKIKCVISIKWGIGNMGCFYGTRMNRKKHSWLINSCFLIPVLFVVCWDSFLLILFFDVDASCFWILLFAFVFKNSVAFICFIHVVYLFLTSLPSFLTAVLHLLLECFQSFCYIILLVIKRNKSTIRWENEDNCFATWHDIWFNWLWQFYNYSKEIKYNLFLKLPNFVF